MMGKLKISIETPNNSADNSISKSAPEKRIENSFAFDINKYLITFDRTCTIAELESAAVSPQFNVCGHSQLLSNVCSSLLSCHDNRVDTVPCVHPSGDATLKSEEKAILHGNEVAQLPASNEMIACIESDCNKSFSSRALMLTHHHTDKQQLRANECPTCHTFCRHASYLNLHMRTHSNERPDICEKCHLSFKTPANLWRHQTQHKEGEQLKFKCEHCPAIFPTENSLKRHKGHRHKS